MKPTMSYRCPDRAAAHGLLTAVTVPGGDDRLLVAPLTSEIDLLTAPVMGAGLRRVLERLSRQLAVDMSCVRLLSAAGITMLIETKNVVDGLGIALVLVGCPFPIRQR